MPRNKVAIGLMGQPAAGKNTVCDLLKKIATEMSLETEVFETGEKGVLGSLLTQAVAQMQYNGLVELKREINRQDLIDYFLGLSKQLGNDILARAMKQRVSESKANIVVYNAVRIPEDAAVVTNFPAFHFVYVTAPLDVRYQRACARNAKGDARLTLEEFAAQDERPTEKQVPEIFRQVKPFATVINNVGGVAELERYVRVLVELDVKPKFTRLS